MICALSIDGGGIRGVIPATILNQIEARTGLCSARLFEYVAGTSTGGILAAGIATGRHSAADMLNLYLQEQKRIFRRSLGWRVRTAGGWLGPKYDGTGLHDAMREHFGEQRLGQARINCMVTTYNLLSRRPRFLKSWDEASQGTSFADAAIATASAPTYFPPYRLSRDELLVDGGVFAPDPAACLLADVSRRHPGEMVFLLSLGTGRHEEGYPPGPAARWGKLGWATRVADLLLDGADGVAAYEVERYPNVMSLRIQTDLPPAARPMDTADLDVLGEVADQLVRDRTEELDRVCDVLLRYGRFRASEDATPRPARR